MKKLRIPYRKKCFSKERIEIRLGIKHRYRRASVYTTPFKIKKLFWYDEFADSDYFTPSCPHLHSEDGKYKLNVYTGELYNIRLKRNCTDKYVPKEELKKLWEENKFIKFSNEMRKKYKEKYPDSSLPDIPLFD